MAQIRVFTTPTCPYCKQAKAWLRGNGCEFEELDITKDVEHLREWRTISGGVGVPVIAHGKDLVIGFSPARLQELVDCCRQTTAVPAAALPDTEAPDPG
ncbi:MAG: glutaredoxin family protein [Gemmatimonadota bacterium]